MAARPLRDQGDGPTPGAGRRPRAARRRGDRRARSAELAELGPLAPRPEELAATIAAPPVPRLERPGRGAGADRQPLPAARRALRPRLRRLAAGRRVPAPRPRRRPLPVRGPARLARARPAPRQRSRGALPVRASAWRCRAGASSSPTATATRTAAPRRARRCWTRCGRCCRRRRTAPCPTRSRRRSPAAATSPRSSTCSPRRPRRTSWRGPLAAHGASADGAALLAAAGVGAEVAARLQPRLAAARAAEAASRAPGPLTNPAVIESLAAVPAYGGTTLELFDACSYRWFAGHELDPQPLEPAPDPLVQGGLMHAALDRLYRERPGGDPLPRPGSLAAWTARGRELLAATIAERELGDHPAERAMARRVERLLERFLAEEAARETGGFEPWLLEASFGAHEVDSERPALDLGGWGLHGAIDRVDRDRDGRAVVIDYKLSGVGDAAGEVRGAGETAAAAVPVGGRRALGRGAGRRPLPRPARHLGAAPARAPSSTRQPATSPATASTTATSSTRRAGRSCWRTPRERAGAIVARMRGRRDSPRPGAPPRPARPRRLPRLLHLRADLPPRPRPAVRRGRRGGGAVSERTPTPEQAAAIAVSGRDVLLEAGAGTGKTGVMVDRYCRLVCDKGVSPDAILAFTFTDKAAAELRQRIRAELARRAEAGSERARELLATIGGAWITTIHGFCNRLLGGHPVAAGIDPGFRVLDAPETVRAAREAFDEALREFLAEPARLSARNWWPPSRSTACGRWSTAVHAELRSRGEAEPHLPEPPPADLPAALEACRGRRRRGARGAEGGATRSASRSSAALARLREPGEPPGLDELRALRTDSRAKVVLAVPRGDRGGDLRVAPRPARAAPPTATWASCCGCSRPASRPPRNGGPGSTSRTCRCWRHACWSGRRSARPTAAASATCWSTSSRTPTACSCG